MSKYMTIFRQFFLLLALTMITSCQTTKVSSINYNDTRLNNQKSQIKKKFNKEWQKHTRKGMIFLEENDLEQASLSFNSALKLNINNSYLQFLNGYAYHLIALESDTTKFKLAEEGYKLAVKFDETNWMARYHLGLLFLDQKQFNNAKVAFADALLYEDNNPNLLQSFIFASYFTKDPVSAVGAANRLCEIEKNSKRCLQNQIMLNATLNDFKKTKLYFGVYKKKFNDNTSYLQKRVKSWNKFYQDYNFFRDYSKDASIKLIQENSEYQENEQETTNDEEVEVTTYEEEEEETTNEEEQTKNNSDVNTDIRKMLITDVVIINSIENASTSSGVNLLNGLTLQFGNTTNNLDAYFSGNINQSFQDNDADGFLDPSGSQDRFVQALTIPAITYSLNIANANTTRNEILARPSLVAYEGQESEFFSGKKIQAGAVGSGEDSDITIEDDIGITLKITPQVVTDDIVKLDVEAERTFLVTPSSSVTFTYQINRSKTFVKSTVTMRRGDTLILSGLSEKETENVRDGVPLLQDIPLVQYFFSKKSTKDINKSVLILITPRSPEYTYLSRKSRKKLAEQSNLSELEVLEQLKGRYMDWFKPYPNWASTFKHLQENTLYREFRTGDVALENWDTMVSRKNRLKQASKFLFF